MRIYLIRHGQTEWNSEGRAQGHTDVQLDRVGRAQARLVAEFFDLKCLGKIYCSDLTRCLQTATPTADLLELPLVQDARLRERTFGELEGQHYTVLRAYFDGVVRDQKIPRWEIRPKGGESLQDVWNRSKPLVEDILATNEDTAIFSHGGTCALILAQILRAPIETALSFRFDNASVTELKRLPIGAWQLLRYSDTRHLDVLHDDLAEA